MALRNRRFQVATSTEARMSVSVPWSMPHSRSQS
jgi:hypothetical protein